MATAAVVLFAVYCLYFDLSNYNASYDSGVYLESARMMGRGFALYRQIFNSQPPLWLPLIYGSFRLFGENFLAGQLVTATAGLITICGGHPYDEIAGWQRQCDPRRNAADALAAGA